MCFPVAWILNLTPLLQTVREGSQRESGGTQTELDIARDEAVARSVEARLALPVSMLQREY